MVVVMDSVAIDESKQRRTVQINRGEKRDVRNDYASHINYPRSLPGYVPLLCLGFCLADVSFNLTYHAYIAHLPHSRIPLSNTSGFDCTTAGIVRKPTGKVEISYIAQT